jgi:thiamine biosynthesis lipoprotein
MDSLTTTLVRREFRAMGTEITLICPDGPASRRRLAMAERWVAAFENRLSRFIPYSELSRLNAAAGRPFPASPLLFDFVRACLEFARISGGVFDPTLLREIEAAGYDRTFDSIAPARHTVEAAQDRPSWREVLLDARARTITLPAGLGVDSGGLGKGWAADRLTRYLGPDCVVDCGGDIAARGSPPGSQGWFIGVQDPFAPETDLALLCVRDRGVATSSVLKRRWRTEAGFAHHLIDSRTRRPSTTDVAAVSVVAASATLADYHAKVALLMGAAEGLAYLDREVGVDGLLVTLDGTRRRTRGLARYLVEP